jgi:hypothetical protein
LEFIFPSNATNGSFEKRVSPIHTAMIVQDF